jgi:hypothetical protein
MAAITAKYAERNRDRQRAWSAVAMAIASGRMTAAPQCDACATTGKRLHAHHADYTKPLDVQWLCPACHKAIHALS